MLYLSAAQKFNDAGYDCLVSSKYKNINPAFLEAGFEPIFDPFAQPQIQRKLTIAEMVHLKTVLKLSFEILYDGDVLDILSTIDEYLEEQCTDASMKDAIFIEYIKRLLIWRDVVYKHFRTCLNRHPQWKQVYVDKEAQLIRIMRSISETNGETMDIVDPIQQLAVPSALRELQTENMTLQERLMGVKRNGSV